jgi:branched-subunit amino acid transport protein AzlD
MITVTSVKSSENNVIIIIISIIIVFIKLRILPDEILARARIESTLRKKTRGIIE